MWLRRPLKFPENKSSPAGYCLNGYPVGIQERCVYAKGKCQGASRKYQGPGSRGSHHPVVAVTSYFSDPYPGEDKLTIVIVEPNQADCMYRTATADDGKLPPVTGDMATIMARLACGEPCTIGGEILWILGNPLGKNQRVISGERGVVTLGLVWRLCREKSCSGCADSLDWTVNSGFFVFPQKEI
ncbi:Diaminopropionate ammonia-lyase [uncultured Blautia sp.]|uniref:hypothetical protein n=1 Tax=Blautia hydrogenotrophica TaxID=53443 RepID=UPI0006DC71A8|nr:hypothetical protein [Blautia hydrogenotrophica]SCI13791.1 Diaminopropionate ammonia-lyase [uncultured Blautia sp.]